MDAGCWTCGVCTFHCFVFVEILAPNFSILYEHKGKQIMMRWLWAAIVDLGCHVENGVDLGCQSGRHSAVVTSSCRDKVFMNYLHTDIHFKSSMYTYWRSLLYTWHLYCFLINFFILIFTTYLINFLIYLLIIIFTLHLYLYVDHIIAFIVLYVLYF